MLLHVIHFVCGPKVNRVIGVVELVFRPCFEMFVEGYLRGKKKCEADLKM